MLEGILISVVVAYIFGYIALKICHWIIDSETQRDIDAMRSGTAVIERQTAETLRLARGRSPKPTS